MIVQFLITMYWRAGLSDLHASADYRRRAAATLAVRAITDAYRAAEGAHAG